MGHYPEKDGSELDRLSICEKTTDTFGLSPSKIVFTSSGQHCVESGKWNSEIPTEPHFIYDGLILYFQALLLHLYMRKSRISGDQRKIYKFPQFLDGGP